MNAAEYLEQQAKSYKMELFAGEEAHHDLYVTPPVSGADLIQLVTLLEGRGYSLSFHKDNSIEVLAPHYGKHPWRSQGWNCGIDHTILGCRVVRQVEGETIDEHEGEIPA